MRHVVIVLLLLAIPAAAAAQPSNSPLNTPAPVSLGPAAPVPTGGAGAGAAAPVPVPAEMASGSYKSESTALALSLGGTIGSFALMGIGGAAENGGLSTIGSLGLWVAPSFGHWYAGDGWTTGLRWRLAGAGAATIGIMWVAVDCIGSDCGESDFHPGLMLAVGGGVAFVGGMIHDIATAPRAARAHNARLEGRVQDVTVRPAFGNDRLGLSVSGRF
jgi:hypothetical protein